VVKLDRATARQLNLFVPVANKSTAGGVICLKRTTWRFAMRRTCFVAFMLATIATAIALTSVAHADQYKWCAVYGGDRGGGGTNCGFITYKQCMDTISGTGGYCTENQFYTGPAGQARKPKRR
jgi:Protein of unknown function (DUF3551)